MPYSAMECMLQQAKTRSVDPDVVRCLINILSLFPIGSYVALKDGSVSCGFTVTLKSDPASDQSFGSPT